MLIYNHEINQRRQRVSQEMTMETGAYMAPFQNQRVRIQQINESQPMIYYQIKEYQLSQDKQISLKNIQNGLAEMIKHSDLVCLICQIKNQNLSLYYGFEMNQSIRKHLETVFPHSKMINTKPQIEHLSSYGGCICGQYHQLDIDTIIQSLLPYDGVFSITMKKVNTIQEQQRLSHKKTQYEKVKQMTYQQHQYNYSSPDIPTQQLIDILSEKLDYLKDSQHVLSECFFASSSYKNACYYGEHLFSCLDIKNQGYIIYTDKNPMQGKIFTTEGSFACNKIDNGFNQLLSIQDAASLLLPPTLSFKGFSVYKTYKDDQDIQIFDIKQPEFSHKSELLIGYNQYHQPYYLPIDYIKQHFYIDGKPGFGKTYLVHYLLEELSKHDIKIFVIESAKKEYSLLRQYIPSLKVYSAGLDALPLHLNIFQPIQGTLVSKHVSSLIGALMSLFDGESPLPEALTRYLYYLYIQHHIPMNTLAKDDMAYPTIHDFLHGIHDFIYQHTEYENKVKGNLTSAIYNRVGSLLEGPTGSIIDCQRGIPIEQLMNQMTVIELDDIESDNRDFIIMVLTNLINEYLRNQPLSTHLKRVLVIEEAHNILMNTQFNNLKETKINASESYARLLSEIRAFDTGIIISDQRPSQISSHVIGNSRLKATFNISECKDIEAISKDYRFSPYQENQLSLLKEGEFLMNVGGYKEIVQLKCERTTKPLNNHWGCLFCKNQCECQIDISIIKDKDYILERITYLTGSRLYQLMTQLSKQYHYPALCLLGRLLDETSLHDVQKRRQLYAFYKEESK